MKFFPSSQSPRSVCTSRIFAGGLLYPVCALALMTSAHAFEGRITATLSRGEEKQAFTFTVGTKMLRIERNETDRPYTQNLISLETGGVTLLFPHSRSFIRLKSPVQNARPDGGQPMSLTGLGLPRGIGPQSGFAVAASSLPPTKIGPTNLPDRPHLPVPSQMPISPALPAGIGTGTSSGTPAQPMMPMSEEVLELKATGEKATLLGYVCARYEIKQCGEIMEIWATDTLLPFQPYLQNQLPRFGPRMIAEQWGDLLRARKLFPLLATLKFENGPERLRFEVKTVAPGKIADADGALFQPPASYRELEPLPF